MELSCANLRAGLAASRSLEGDAESGLCDLYTHFRQFVRIPWRFVTEVIRARWVRGKTLNNLPTYRALCELDKALKRVSLSGNSARVCIPVSRDYDFNPAPFPLELP